MQTLKRLEDSPPLSWQQTIQFLSKPLDLLDTLNQKYGDIFTIRLGNSHWVSISSPQGIKEMFSTPAEHLESGAIAGLDFPSEGPQSLPMLYGEPHKRRRKLLTPSFHGERLSVYGALIQEITEQVIHQLPLGKPLLVRSCVDKITFEVILKTVFGFKDGWRYHKIKKFLYARMNPRFAVLESAMLFFPALRKDLGTWSPWGHLMQLQRQIDELIYSEIEECRTQPNSLSNDILSLMMSACDVTGEPMTNLELRSDLMAILAVGHDTVTSALSWALYWIHSSPQVLEKLLCELHDLGDRPDIKKVLQLPYLQAVCQETLRIYPVAMFTFPRVVRSPLKIMDYQLDPGTVLAASIYLMHHRQEVYPEPKKFQPERFLKRQFATYEYLPFGGSHRSCLGMAFAQLEMKVVLATLLSRCQLALVNSKPLQPVMRGQLLAPASGFQMINIKRI